MRILGLEIKRADTALTPAPAHRSGWKTIMESFPGAFQQNVEISQGTLLCYPTLYACIMRISQDIGKLPFQLMRRNDNGVWKRIENPSYSPVLRKPNHYQTQQQFRESWILSKLIQGNTYVLKVRDNRGVVVNLYVLDPCKVMPMVSDSGDVFYQLKIDNLSLITGDTDSENLMVPAREIIHDREATLHHPLIGVPPLCAAYWPALKNMRILKNSSDFFANGASPGGILTAPGAIGDETAKRLAEYWNTNFTGSNAGRVAVVGEGLKYEQLSANATDSQMVEQLRYSDEQICQPFGMPPFKVGIGALPAGQKVDDINNLYYADALQTRIEHMENLLDEGLNVAQPMGIECDLWPLMRMDREKLARVEGQMIKDGVSTPNEARLEFNKEPIEGGDTVYMQHQDYSIQALAWRDSQPNPFAPTGAAALPALPPPEEVEDEPDPEAETRAMIAAIERRFAEAA